jgi:magnesium-transporting ATPase (P-type)
LQSSPNGLGQDDAAARLQHYGRNTLPASEPPGIVRVFLHQFASPLIYVLAAALVSLLIQEWSDAGFICAVLLLNAIIGTTREYSAQRAATAMQQLVTTCSRVSPERAGTQSE